jgi:hypothetical protein
MPTMIPKRALRVDMACPLLVGAFMGSAEVGFATHVRPYRG